MKRLLIALLITFNVALYAAEIGIGFVPVKWNAVEGEGITYRIYVDDKPLVETNRSTILRIDVGDSIAADIAEVRVAKVYAAVVAVKDGVESLFSNVLILEGVESPSDLRTVVIQFSPTVKGEWTDVGFLKLRIP